MPRKKPVCFCVLFVLGVLGGCASPNGPVEVSVSPQAAYLTPSQAAQFTATVTGDNSGVIWKVNGVAGGNSTVGTIDANGNYTAPNVTQNASTTVTATSKRDPVQIALASVYVMGPGQVTTTKNPQVALYTINPPGSANVSIQFGPDTNYGLTTWSQATPAGGGPVSIYVAGMRANTAYHMRATVQFAGAGSVDDADHTFTTSSLPTAILPQISAATTAGMTPQSGVELLSLTRPTSSNLLLPVVTDLAGNVLWGYDPGLPIVTVLDPIKMLPNGHFLMVFAGGGTADGNDSVMQEVDLGNNVVWQMTSTDLNDALAAATCAGCNITVVGMHHDYALLPNGHLVVIAAQQQVISGTTVTGDVLIELDQNHKPVWLWSEFDHLDINRRPYMWPDWTHTNSIVYSPSDHDLIVSIRHQFWVIKIDYNDGQGTGNILWRLGWQGDFTLQGGTDPLDWFYAQHDANVISSNSSGTFELALFDNGDNRELDDRGDVCGTATPCYSRVPTFQIDEESKVATIEWVDNLSPVYSVFGGNNRLLNNGNIEFDVCGLTLASLIEEVTKTSPPQTVWQMQLAGQNAYRGFRIPSLYPGVQW